MTSEQYKALSVKEFDRAAKKYESGHAGIYELCKKDYLPILEELEKEPFETLLDCGYGTAPTLSLLSERRYTGIDISPGMLDAARAEAALCRQETGLNAHGNRVRKHTERRFHSVVG